MSEAASSSSVPPNATSEDQLTTRIPISRLRPLIKLDPDVQITAQDAVYLIAKGKGPFPPSHFSNKHDDKLAHKVALQTNVTHFCLVCQ
jgi:hypothetical protein